MAGARVIVCNTMDPFVTGGSELFAARLTDELNRAGHRATQVTFPFRLRKFHQYFLAQATLPWETLNLTGFADVVIPLRFPTWLVQHPNKVVYLNHQLRIAYDLFDAPHGIRSTPDTLAARDYVRACDTRLSEAKKLFAVSRNVAARLQHFNGMEAELLYHGLPLEGRHRRGEYGDYVLSIGRLVSMKRLDLLIRAMALTTTPVRCLIGGQGREQAALEALIASLGVAEKVHLLGWTSEDDLIDLYSGALGVYYAPVDEDYGLVTLEAFQSAKPVLTATDSGGVLEFVADGVNGFILPPEPAAFAMAIDQLYLDRRLARTMGEAGADAVRHVSWANCISRLSESF
ncbi:MAG TPA: glycosyltransferase family 4 protein [Symbiobacteriaceae bacterium]|nr:glycosyltransferase family 4 protein [Symbiobacteriaceae bacterium]